MQPLSLALDREKHEASLELQKAFQRSFESFKDDFSSETWLRLATWWLIKSRIISQSIARTGLQRRGTDATQYQNGWEKSVSKEQAYADLLKASWILEEIVLTKAKEEDLSFTIVRRIIKDLIANISKDLRERREKDSIQPSFHDEIILKQDLSLLESFEQEIEAKENVPKAIDDPSSSHRWFNTDRDNAGVSRERVIFRTYVNAQLGEREHRSKSSSAPYMLLLWTTGQQSDLLISVCNQRGTVNLSRKLQAGDLERYMHADDFTPFQVDFPSQEAEIMFLSAEDVSSFLDQPRVFFAAMKEMTPKPGELAIYQAPVLAYSETSVPPYSKSRTHTKMVSGKFSSCGLRIYESMPDRCWKTTRRLVVSSPPDCLQPGCVSHWLPLDHIRIMVDGAKATVSWSDCGHLETIDEGNFRSHKSFVYKAESPNCKLHLEFTSESEALSFRDSLLLPTEMPPQITTKIEVCSSFQSTRIYRLFDADEPDKHGYHAIALTKKNPQGPHMTEIFCAYQDLDWMFSGKLGMPNVIDFECLYIPHYTSTIPRLNYDPRPTDTPPEFSDVTESTRKAHMEFGCDHDLIHFMHALTGWSLKFFRVTEKLVLVDTSSFIVSSKNTFKGADIQIWEKSSDEGRSRTQVAVRLGGPERDRWITAALADNNYRNRDNTIEIDRLAIQRGVGVDTKEMTARRRATEQQSSTKKKWKIAITFKSGSGKCFP